MPKNMHLIMQTSLILGFVSAPVTLSVAPTAFAQEPNAIADTFSPNSADHAVEHRLGDEIIVLSSPFSTRQNDLLTTTHIISEEEVGSHMSDTLGDLLDQLPGVDQAPHGSAVGQPLIRGLGGFRLAVLEDGLNNGDVFATGGDHANAISLVDQYRIEVIKGAETLRYGPYATTGVINMFSRHMDPEKGVHNIATGGYASNGHEEFAGVYSSITTEKMGVSGSAYYLNSGNIKIPTHAESSHLLALEGEEAADTAQRVANSDRDMKTFSAAGHFGGSQSQLSVSTNRFEAAYGIVGHAHHDEADGANGGAGDSDPADERVAIAITKQTSRIKLSGDADDMDVHYQLDLAVTNYNHAERENGMVATQFGQDTTDLRFELSALPFGLPFENSLSTLGASWKQNNFTARGDEAYIPDSDTDIFAAYYLTRYDQDRWMTEAALRYDHYDVATTNTIVPTISKQYSLFNFSGGVGYRPWEDGLIGLSYARTARAPSAVELFANGLHAAAQRYEQGQATLTAEKSNTVEVFIRHEIENGGVDLSVFNMDYGNFIYLQDTGTDIDGMNVLAYRQQGATVRGYELSVHSENEWAGFEFSNELTWTSLRGTLDDNVPFRAMPADKLTWNGQMRWGRFDLGAKARFTQDQNRLSPGEIKTDGYRSLDLSFGWHAPFKAETTVKLDIVNVTDAEIRHHTGDLKDFVPQPGRNVRLTLRMEL